MKIKELNDTHYFPLIMLDETDDRVTYDIVKKLSEFNGIVNDLQASQPLHQWYNYKYSNLWVVGTKQLNYYWQHTIIYPSTVFVKVDFQCSQMYSFVLSIFQVCHKLRTRFLVWSE